MYSSSGGSAYPRLGAGQRHVITACALVVRLGVTKVDAICPSVCPFVGIRLAQIIKILLNFMYKS